MASGLNLQAAPETVLLVGTGAVSGSWVPVRNALKRYYPYLPEGEENLAFAVLINNLRHISSVMQGGVKLFGLEYIKQMADAEAKLNQELGKYNAIKREIATALKNAQDDTTLQLRPSILKVKERWIDTANTHAVLTTNWDMMLETVFAETLIFHLHGDITDPASLYLPTEQSWEPYRFHDAGKVAMPDHYRRITHANWLVTEAKQFIIFGLSLSPLDAELHQLIWSAASQKKIEKVIIIDPSPRTIRERFRFHSRGDIENIEMILPQEL